MLTNKMNAALAIAIDYTARRLVRKGKIKLASRLCSLAARLKPTAYRFLATAEIRFQLDELDEAKNAAENAIRLGAGQDLFAAWFIVGLISARRNDLRNAISALEQSRKIYPANPQAIYALASLLACAGDFTEADRLFSLDVPVATGTGNPTYTRALRFHNERSPAWAERARVTQNLCEPKWIGKAFKATYFVAADSVYFCRYGKALARSINFFGNDEILLHFHIINPDLDAMETLYSITSKYSEVRATSETIDISCLTEDQKKVYYSCARYIVLKDIFASESMPIIVADMDQLLISSPQPLLDIAKAADVMLLRFDDQSHNLFSLLSATLMVVTPGAGARRFTERLETKIEDAIGDAQNLTWHLDQAALVTTYLSEPDIQYGFVPPSMIHLNDGEPPIDRPKDVGIFWSITNSIASNSKKLNTNFFLRLME